MFYNSATTSNSYDSMTVNTGYVDPRWRWDLGSIPVASEPSSSWRIAMTTAAKHHRSWPYHTLFCIPALGAEIDTRVHIPILHSYKWLTNKRRVHTNKMRLTGSRAYTRPTPIPKMPTGLVELMEDLTRDVLKNNPPDVYEFCAGHMRKLLDIRDGPSLKRPLTLEDKIARAQEKVKKRADARWQRYLKEKKNDKSISKVQSSEVAKKDKGKPSSPIDQPVLKPPVYPDFNIENSSEIEISHEQDYVNDSPVNTFNKPCTNTTEVEDKTVNNENMELNHSIEKAGDSNMPKYTDNSHPFTNDMLDANLSPNAEKIDDVTETVSDDNSVSRNKNVNVIADIKADSQNIQISLPIANTFNETTIAGTNEELSNASNFTIFKDGVVDNYDSKILSSQETAPTMKDISNKSEQENGYQDKTSIADMGNIVNTTIGIINIINETSRSPSQKVETVDDLNDDNNHNLLKTQNKDNFQNYIEKGNLLLETATPNVNKSKTIDESAMIMDSDKKMEKRLVNQQSEFSLTDDEIVENNEQAPVPVIAFGVDVQKDKSVDANNKELENFTVLSIGNDLHKGVTEEDNHLLKLVQEKNTSEYGNNNLKPTIAHVNEVIGGSHESLKTDNVTDASRATSNHDDLSLAPTGVEVLGLEEPLSNVVHIKESGNVQEEPIEGNIIEITISQVAEVLNNEMPITIDNVNILEESSPFISSLEKGNNGTHSMDIKEENETQINLDPEGIDFKSNMTSVNLDNVQNENITSSKMKSTSIHENTEEIDNIIVIESRSSEDLFLNNANNSNMDLETAAVTIQKVFRSFMFKSRASTFDDNDDNISLDEDNDKKKNEPEFQTTNINKERRGISRMDTVLQTVNEEKSLSLSTDDSSTLSSAATTIQAHVRGFLVRNKLNSNKTASTNSLVNSDGHDDEGFDHKTNKTILNIHIVPEGGNYLSRDESMLTSMDLSLDGSPPSSLNLHPLGYDKNERRKLKREDAIQSISPPSNNSGKLSEDVDSVKDMLITEGEHRTDQKDDKDNTFINDNIHNRPGSGDTSPTNSLTIETVVEASKLVDQDDSSDADTEAPVINSKGTLTKQSSDEMDVVTPFEDKNSLADSTSTSKLMHSGEFHDVVLPTKVSRGDTSVVSEFKNVLVYFLLWNNS